MQTTTVNQNPLPRPSSATRRRRSVATVLAGALVGTLAVALPAAPASAEVPEPVPVHSTGNPILSDGSYYSADAAPLVVDDTLYVYTGHDEAAEQQAGFEMHDYGVLVTDDVASGEWQHYAGVMDPGEVFGWATGNNAYAGQVTTGADGRFYWYAPVEWDNTAVPNRMAIGVAVSESPVGPWVDAIGEPLLTWTDVFGASTSGQEVIDPHVFTDVDGRVYLYWGSWGVARAVELEPTMTATTGPISTLSGLTSFYEAPWVFERGGTYYLAYDWKQGGSECTPSNYQACIAYATAENPLGPWTYQGIILGGTSATTVHPSVVELDGRWYLTYHTKDAVGGGHFRRSVAIDEVTWDGDRMNPVVPTRADDPAYRLSDNLATGAHASASYTEQPPMTLRALNDGRALTALLPPDQWGNYRGTTMTQQTDWIQYTWDAPVRTGGVGLQLHRDGNWIRPPASWTLEYLDAAGDWRPVEGATYPTATDVWHTVTFTPVTTTALRATFRGQDEGAAVHSVAVSEWEVYAVAADAIEPVAVATRTGQAPALPAAVRLPFGDAGRLWVPVNWRAVDPAAYAAPGTFTVEGRALGQAAGYVTATVTVGDGTVDPGPDDTLAPTVTLAASGTSGQDGWFSSAVTVRAAADDDVDYLPTVETRVGDGAWVTTPGVRSVDVPVTAQGSTTVQARARDAAGNVSAEVSRTVKVDTTAPVASGTLDAATRAVTLDASDALSGLAVLEHRWDGAGDWVASTPGTSGPTGTTSTVVQAPDTLPHELTYRARDLAGNVTTGTVRVPVADGAQLQGNVAPYASGTASFTSGWEDVGGLNDGTNGVLEDDASKVGASWGTWDRVGEQWAQLTWEFDVTVDQVGVWWYQNVPDAQNEGLIAPRSWVLQHQAADGSWVDVTLADGSAYGRDSEGFASVAFAPVTTRALRVVAQSWGAAAGQGSVGIREWQAIAPEPDGTVTPVAPTFTAATTCTAGVPDAATVQVPTVDGVVYRVAGEVVQGTLEVAADATVTLTAEAADGFALADGAVREWTQTFVAPQCPVVLVPVEPQAPTFTASVCTDGEPGPGAVTVPAVEGVVHRVEARVVEGTVEVPLGTTVSVLAVPAEGYVLEPGPQAVTWAFRADPADCSPGVAVTPGTVVVRGAAKVGLPLRAVTSGWGPSGVRLAYTWSADGVVVAGAEAATFVPTAAQQGAVLAVRVTGFGAGLVSTSVVSDPTGTVGARPWWLPERSGTWAGSAGGTPRESSRTDGAWWLPEPTRGVLSE
ncbi:family 43 glycosylhydrolase [Cellulomonas soli]|uniref:Bacterial Ig-like domain-containing protein n=1 Tax=Cellulomonas soli TaxID=931535 RepID=A0A512PE15_9CELL|nr:family 43 glycosylhydrolase [Cellulomonas soli]GEP69449.1 hypothetical protein CSO01_21640 [Cellulomonas soli]